MHELSACFGVECVHGRRGHRLTVLTFEAPREASPELRRSHLLVGCVCGESVVVPHADGQEVKVHELGVRVGVLLERIHGCPRNGLPRPVIWHEEGPLLVAHQARQVVVHLCNGGDERMMGGDEGNGVRGVTE